MCRSTPVSYTHLKEVAIKPNLKILLKPDTEVLDEVLVVAYGTTSRQSITGAVASIDSKKLEMRPVTEVTGTLEGAAPGIQAVSYTHLQCVHYSARRISGDT